MDELLTYLYTALPFLFVAAVAALAVIGIGIGTVWPRFLVYPYLALFFWINSTSYGNLAVFVSPGLYSRGSGLLYFALVQWYILGAWCCARVAASFQGWAPPACNLRPWFLAWFLLLLAHVGAALFVGVTLAEALAPSGFANIVWMAPLVSLMLLAFRDAAQVTELSRFILLAALGRATFGLVRWAAFGGDPNNVYANMDEIRIRLTFFDINDSLVCTLGFALAAVNLFQPAKLARARFWVLVEWLTLLATALCIVLSYRRTAWIGLVLAGLVVLWRFPWRRRVQLLAAGAPVVGAGLLHVAAKRFTQTRGAGGGLSSLFYDIQTRRFGGQSERLLELKLALADFLNHLVTGIGSWGRYAGYQQISWQANPDGGLFLHSGVLHIALKTGLVGLILFAGTATAFVLAARRALSTVAPEQLALATAGTAGVAFMLPDILVGTPIPQVRTMAMLAICMALPYLALGALRPAQALAQPGRAPIRLKPVYA
jgi:hypothetical protein